MVRDYENDPDEHWHTAQRRHVFLGASMAVLMIALIGLAWYGYVRLRRDDLSMAQVTGVHQAVDTLSGQMKEARTRFADWARSQEDVRQQVDKFGHEMRSRLETISKQTSDAREALTQRVATEVETRVSPIATKIDRLETTREQDQTRIASLQQELGAVRGEMERQASELSAVRQQVDETRSTGATTERQLASLQENQQHDRQDVDAINNKLAVQRVDFEVGKGRSRQLTPDISLGLTGIDVRYRRVSGWMWVMPDRKTIWLRNQSAQEPLVFYGATDGKKRELVITGVTQDSIAGYLILSKETQPPQQPASIAVPARAGDPAAAQ